eukprot:scaffold24585_cov102-Isochrysis_galbana.AAC.2
MRASDAASRSPRMFITRCTPSLVVYRTATWPNRNTPACSARESGDDTSDTWSVSSTSTSGGRARPSAVSTSARMLALLETHGPSRPPNLAGTHSWRASSRRRFERA